MPPRYVPCPASSFVHAQPIGLLVTRNGPKKKPTAWCGRCKTRVFLGPRFEVGMGFTREQFEQWFPGAVVDDV